MIVTVLGMHRSGTSVVTRMLNLLGVYLGPEERLFGARADNPKGFWEHRDLVRINNDILAHIGGSWRRLPSFPSGWEDAPELELLRARAQAVIERDFAAVSVWGWKDPSTSLVLPFWQQILPSMQYIVCLRDPIDSARSLQKRGGLSLEEGIDQWLKHVLSALLHTTDQSRILVFYEEVMQNWLPVLRRMAHFLGRPEWTDRPDVQQQMEEFIDRDLQHFRTSATDVTELGLPPAVVAAVRQAYKYLERSNDRYQQKAVDMLLDASKTVSRGAEESRQKAYEKWTEMACKVADEIVSLVPIEDMLILVDDNELGRDIACGRRTILFLEEEGHYLGPPPDDTTAINELEHLREAGARYIVFTWPAFWWLEHFVQFHKYLRSSFPCVVCNDCLIVFRLHGAGQAQAGVS